MTLARSESPLPSVQRYRRHLDVTTGWIERSIQNGHGGSSALFSPVGGWSNPYPETSGYLIPTLLRLADFSQKPSLASAAESLGNWLLSIRRADGGWSGGTHPAPPDVAASTFNSAQVITGLMALHRSTQEVHWLDAAVRAAELLAERVRPDGLWPPEYRASQMPSYYAFAVAPLLEVWQATGHEHLRKSSVRVLDRIVSRRNSKGALPPWGFDDGGSAHTHTIAYTIAGLLDAAKLLDDADTYRHCALPALERLLQLSELRRGKLPGLLDDELRPLASAVCLTGNAQLALCLLELERQEDDLRLVNAACKLVDVVCGSQWLRSPVAGFRGAVAGSSPLWGSYLRFRFPNWAAKFHCDALISLVERLEKEEA